MDNGMIKEENDKQRGIQSVMFQVYINRKIMYRYIKYHTSTKRNINTSVVIKFHVTCKQTCSSSVPMSCHVLVALSHLHLVFCLAVERYQ